MKTRFTRLAEILKDLQTELGKNLDVENYDENKVGDILQQIKTLEAEKNELKKKERLQIANKKHELKRAILSDFLKLSLPLIDITNNDGSFHVVKLKKAIELQKFVNRYSYVELSYDERKQKYVSLGIRANNREFFTFYIVDYNNSYFNDLETILKFNSVQLKPLSFLKFKSLEKKILKETLKIEAAIKSNNEKMKSFDCYFLENENLIGNNRQSHYKGYRSI